MSVPRLCLLVPLLPLLGCAARSPSMSLRGREIDRVILEKLGISRAWRFYLDSTEECRLSLKLVGERFSPPAPGGRPEELGSIGPILSRDATIDVYVQGPTEGPAGRKPSTMRILLRLQSPTGSGIRQAKVLDRSFSAVTIALSSWSNRSQRDLDGSDLELFSFRLEQGAEGAATPVIVVKGEVSALPVSEAPPPPTDEAGGGSPRNATQ